MNGGRPEPANGAVYAGAVALFAVASFAVYAYLGAQNPHVGYFADDALYLLMAEIYSPWRAAVGAVYDHVRLYSQLPPLYPLLLGLVGSGPDAVLPARLATAACMSLAWLAYGNWLRTQGVPRAATAVLVALCAAAPVTLFNVVDLWSEGLYMLLAFVALTLALRLGRRPSFGAVLLLGTVIALAVLTRTVGLALLPAALLPILRRRPLLALPLLLGAWGLLFAFAPLSMGAATDSYAGLLLHYYSGDPLSALARQAGALGAELPRALLYDFFALRTPSRWQWWVIAVLGLMMVSGTARELRARPVTVVHVAAYLAIVFVWPFPDHLERFLFPLLPFALYLAWRGLPSSRAPRAAAVIIALLVLSLTAPVLSGTARRALTPVPVAALDSWRTTRYWLDPSRGGDPLAALENLDAHRRAALLVAAHVPENECVYSVDSALVLRHGRRAAFLPPPERRMRRGPPWGCRWFLLVATPSTGRPALYPVEHLRQHARGIAVERLRADEPGSPLVAVLMRATATGPQQARPESGLAP